jgi:hypothetical protein
MLSSRSAHIDLFLTIGLSVLIGGYITTEWLELLMIENYGRCEIFE